MYTRAAGVRLKSLKLLRYILLAVACSFLSCPLTQSHKIYFSPQQVNTAVEHALNLGAILRSRALSTMQQQTIRHITLGQDSVSVGFWEQEHQSRGCAA